VRYITASRGDNIYMVDAEPDTLIGESGRILTGYREHKCPEIAENTPERSEGQSALENIGRQAG
jgi:hypothetical protein